MDKKEMKPMMKKMDPKMEKKGEKMMLSGSRKKGLMNALGEKHK